MSQLAPKFIIAPLDPTPEMTKAIQANGGTVRAYQAALAKAPGLSPAWLEEGQAAQIKSIESLERNLGALTGVEAVLARAVVDMTIRHLFAGAPAPDHQNTFGLSDDLADNLRRTRAYPK